MTTQIKGNATSTFGGNVDVTGNVITDAPAFSAYGNTGVSMSHNTATKILFQVESFDTNSNYDASTSRFTPTVAGYYQFNAAVTAGNSSTGVLTMWFYKNGSQNHATQSPQHPNYVEPNINAVIYMNGTTDYIEVYAQQNSGSTQTSLASLNYAYFNGFLARAV